MTMLQLLGGGLLASMIGSAIIVVYYRICLIAERNKTAAAKAELAHAEADIEAFNLAAKTQAAAIDNLKTQVETSSISGSLAVHQMDLLRSQLTACQTPASVVDRLNAAAARLAAKPSSS